MIRGHAQVLEVAANQGRSLFTLFNKQRKFGSPAQTFHAKTAAAREHIHNPGLMP
jgi:hypothetical protein